MGESSTHMIVLNMREGKCRTREKKNKEEKKIPATDEGDGRRQTMHMPRGAVRDTSQVIFQPELII